MNTGMLKPTQVDLDGLLEVLSKNLYSTPDVVVRELVQNAHDSINRRQIEAVDFHEAGHIRVRCDPDRRLLSFEDDGAGLTEEEIDRYLAVVGRGYTSTLRQGSGGERFIGAFGLGFLSAYVVSEHVEVWTSSHTEPHKSWRFTSVDGKRYGIEPAEKRPVGTAVLLRLKEDFSHLADPRALGRIIEFNCALLPLPVYLNDTIINPEPPPWRLVEEPAPLRLRKLRLDFAERSERLFKALDTMPVEPSDEVPAKGLLWIQDGTTYGNQDNRNLRVFVRGMLVDADARELLPSWAGFIGGTVEADHLTPTAGREDLQKDKAWKALQNHLRETLIDSLSHVAHHRPETWRMILRRHNEALRGAALADDRLFELLADSITLPTSEGELTAPVIVTRSQGRIYIKTTDTGGAQELLQRALRSPVVDARMYAVAPYCQRFAALRQGQVIALGTREGDAQVFSQAQIDKNHSALLEDLFGNDDRRIIPTRFEPTTLPMVLSPNANVRLKRRIENDEADKRISQSILTLARIFTERTDDDEAAELLYINLDAPVIRALFEADKGDQKQAARLLRLLVELTVASAGDENEHRRFDETLAEYSDAVLHLLKNEV